VTRHSGTTKIGQFDGFRNNREIILGFNTLKIPWFRFLFFVAQSSEIEELVLKINTGCSGSYSEFYDQHSKNNIAFEGPRI
jgi:hypothetical protein